MAPSTLSVELADQKAHLILYLHSKIKASDWHAVQDAASDIREIEAKLELLTDIEKSPVLPLSAIQPFDRQGR